MARAFRLLFVLSNVAMVSLARAFGVMFGLFESRRCRLFSSLAWN
jgi:hypothetical protein